MPKIIYLNMIPSILIMVYQVLYIITWYNNSYIHVHVIFFPTQAVIFTCTKFTYIKSIMDHQFFSACFENLWYIISNIDKFCFTMFNWFLCYICKHILKWTTKLWGKTKHCRKISRPCSVWSGVASGRHRKY